MGALACKGVDAFGAAVEAALIKHGKNIIHEQFLLNRLANATIDIYVSSCVLSRCSKSLTEGIESAHHEEMMAKVWCKEAHTRWFRFCDLINVFSLVVIKILQ